MLLLKIKVNGLDIVQKVALVDYLILFHVTTGG